LTFYETIFRNPAVNSWIVYLLSAQIKDNARVARSLDHLSLTL